MINLTVGPGEEDNAGFGDLLFTLRTEAKLSRAELAEILDLSSEYIRIIENGQRTPAFDLMEPYLQAMGKTCDIVGENTLHIDMPDVLYSITFTSRIVKARNRVVVSGTRGPTRDEMIGRIVRSIATADTATLEKLYRKLPR